MLAVPDFNVKNPFCFLYTYRVVCHDYTFCIPSLYSIFWSIFCIPYLYLTILTLNCPVYTKIYFIVLFLLLIFARCIALFSFVINCSLHRLFFFRDESTSRSFIGYHQWTSLPHSICYISFTTSPSIVSSFSEALTKDQIQFPTGIWLYYW